MAQRKAITQDQLARWPNAPKSEKGAILDAVCGVTGWHRDHARKAIRTMLANPETGPRQPQKPVQRYDQAAVELLTRCWGRAGRSLR